MKKLLTGRSTIIGHFENDGERTAYRVGRAEALLDVLDAAKQFVLAERTQLLMKLDQVEAPDSAPTEGQS